jgi:hypothetical protein
MKTNEIANRHLLAADGLQNLLQAEEQSIRIVVAERWASSYAGQLLASALVNLLCRQVRLVRHVEVVAPDTPTLIKLPCRDSANRFPACLEALAAWAVNGAVSVTASQTATIVDYTVLVGEAAQEPCQGQRLFTVGDGWRAWVSDPSNAGPAVSPASRNPLGPFLAAALAAGEIFKHSRGILRGRFLSGDGYSLWSGASSRNWTDLHDGPEIWGTILPPTHVVGAGAVGNALAYIITNLGFAEGYIVLIDDDHYDDTNLNRCLLAGWLDIAQHKIYAIERALKGGGIEVFPFPGTIKSYVADARLGLRADVAQQTNDLLFSVVASCVDKGTSRQDVQGLHPQLLLGGSTFNLQTKSNLYSGCPGTACLACFNPAEKDGEKIRALENQLRNMPTRDRGEFLTAHRLDARAIEEYLSGAQCGGLGEAALRNFAVRPPAEFSVGFVSLGAGLLLASALLRNTIFSTNPPARGDMATLNFLNGGLADSWLGADDNCQLNCQAKRA